MCGHVSPNPGPALLGFLSRLPPSTSLLLTLHKDALRQVQGSIEGQYHWEELRHRRLGGLTSARVIALWRSNYPGKDSALRPGARQGPLRPLAEFLEPSTRLTEWRLASSRDAGIARTQNVCWCPMAVDATPYPWPWAGAPRWVETTSVFFGGVSIQRPLSDKAFSQLMDLREDWGANLIHLLLEWDHGASPPLRMSVELVLSALSWLGLDSRHKGQGEDAYFSRKGLNGSISDRDFDWACIRAPFLGMSEGKSGPDSPIECLAYFGWVWEPGDAVNVATATKADDTEVNLALWNVGGDDPGMEHARSVLRNWLHSRWRQATTTDAVHWLHNQGSCDRHEQWQRNRDAIVDCVTRAANSTWWEWSDGSRLFFWRWPALWRLEARDGTKSYRTTDPPPRRHFPRVPVTEPWIIEKDTEKLRKLIIQRYILPGTVRTVVPRFPVQKGEDDIRVVWDLTKNGLNPLTFTPSFFLPTASSYVRRSEAGMWAVDFDIGEQFHNYPLHVSEQAYCGVNLPMGLVEEMRAKGLVVERFMRCDRLVFGWHQSSPYFALSHACLGARACYGQPLRHHPRFSMGADGTQPTWVFELQPRYPPSSEGSLGWTHGS